MQRSEAIVEARGLTRAFRDFWMRTRAMAVDHIDLEIRSGEIFGLLGPNGSGKSTTIKMILGLLRPTAGRLSVFGRPATDVAVKRHIGFLPEESYLYRYLTPLETLDYYGRLFGLRRVERRRRSEQLLDMVGLSGVAHRHVGEFSKGMMRRIGLAQALVNDPEFLILDEPTSGLDPIGTKLVKELILDLRSRGKTILLSSHLLGDVQDVCDRMVMLYGGKIRAEGTVDDLLQDTERTVIRTGRLDQETIDRIDAVLRERGGAIEQVESPKQRLEDLFLDIVEQARKERIATSGATEGGETAAFLRSEKQSGDDLVDHLQNTKDAKAVGRVVAKESRNQPGAASEVLDTLLKDTPAPARAAVEKPQTPAPADVDQTMIDRLTGGGGDADESGDRT
ncbi:MAG: ABC transporter ATP-binding protein [Phycisphaerae bacterium]|nr:ABC transporter ATP-binding protein [Phycisphaerae bacterium]MBT5383328.1 ABC transporter ATP-binding protein [Phycisphaerae bacterium]MBT5657263.1 ABC transporter ATP-binding protein [Phycisphaerae bacterium]